MPEICYVDKRFGARAQEMIGRARAVCSAYAEQGYDLTLRQLYYQFVSRGWIENRDSEYKRLGGVINDARLAGLLDWDYIVDRTRKLEGPGTQDSPHWSSPAAIIRAAARGYQIDKWSDQEYRIEAWIEKDALKGVLEQACPALDIAFFSCRGYASQSEIWGAAQRLGTYIDAGQKVVILHLGDHDPSGIDMTRDIRERLSMFIAQDRFSAPSNVGMELYEEDVENVLIVDRIALNMDQIIQYNPPPNPAKLTDVRARGYIAMHGESSWELDALDPATLVDLVENAVAGYRDDEEWEAKVEREKQERVVLTATHERWEDVKSFLNGDG
jgi:hypothetical protein